MNVEICTSCNGTGRYGLSGIFECPKCEYGWIYIFDIPVPEIPPQTIKKFNSYSDMVNAYPKLLIYEHAIVEENGSTELYVIAHNNQPIKITAI